MLSGRHPFKSTKSRKKSKQQIFKQITDDEVEMLPGFSKEASSLLSSLLKITPEEWIGFSPKDAEEIIAHPFFESVDWKSIENLEVSPPYIPFLNDEEDTSNIDWRFTENTPSNSSILGNSTNTSEIDKFSDFTYNKSLK